MNKICSKCGSEFFKEKHGRVCRKCLNEKQRIDRTNSQNKYTKHYEKTEKGFVMRMYRNMLSRISGIQKKSAYLYLGKEILDRDIFYNWCLNNHSFKNLFKKYKESGYDRLVAPSIDRIDSSRGYVIGNIRIITHHQNSLNGLSLAFQRRRSGTIQRPSIRRPSGSSTLTPLEVTDIRKRRESGESIKSLAKEFSVTESNIYMVCSGRSWKYLLSPNELEVKN